MVLDANRELAERTLENASGAREPFELASL